MGLDIGPQCCTAVDWPGAVGRDHRGAQHRVGCEPRWGGATEAHRPSERREASSRDAGAMAGSTSPCAAPADVLDGAGCGARLSDMERLAKFGHV